MAHFAELNENNIVINVIVLNNNELLDADGNESEQKGIDFCVAHYGGRWIQTSYNATFRGIYAGIGNTYNQEEDIFIVPKPFASWTRNGSFWQAPTPYPTDGLMYQWVEADLNWQSVTVPDELID